MKSIKKTLACFTAATLLTACGGTDQLLSTGMNLLTGNTNGTATSTSTSTDAGSSALSGISSALSGDGLFGNVLSSFLGSGSVKQADLVGTWQYTGADCVFESDNLLKKAGGAVAANEIEKQINTNLAKVGIKQGSCTFTFDSQKNFTATIGGKKISGTYTLDEKNKKITLSTLLGLGKLTANVARSGNQISLLFDSDKLLKLAQIVGSVSGSTAVQSLGNLAASYDGMMIGLQMKK